MQLQATISPIQKLEGNVNLKPSGKSDDSPGGVPQQISIVVSAITGTIGHAEFEEVV